MGDHTTLHLDTNETKGTASSLSNPKS